jgi:alkylhydroperoxidase family enzyme
VKRSTIVEYEAATPEVRGIYDDVMETLGTPSVLNVLKALGHNENILRAVWSMLKFAHVNGEVPALLKELILFRISVKAGNEYCESLHGHAALDLDPSLTYDDLMALSEGQAHNKLPASFQAAIEIVSRAALEPKSVADDDFDYEEQLRDEGFSEPEIDELLAQGYFGVMMNMLTDAYDIPREQPFPPDDQ